MGLGRSVVAVLVAGAVRAGADEGVVCWDPKSTLTVRDAAAASAAVTLSSPACKLNPCNGSWTVPAAPATVSVDARTMVATVAFTGPARALEVVPGAVTDSWWEIFVELAAVAANGTTVTFAARVDGPTGALVEAGAANRSTVGAGDWTVDPSCASGGYLDAGIDLVLRDGATGVAARVPDVEDWVTYAYVAAAANVRGTRALFSGLVRLPAAAARRSGAPPGGRGADSPGVHLRA